MSDDQEKKRNKIRTGDNSIAIQGNVTGSNIVSGNNNVINQNVVNISAAFAPIYRAVDEHPALTPAVKEDVKAEIKDVEKEIQNGDKANESSMTRHLRNVQRMAPDMLDVVVATMANPVAGLGMVAKKIAEKAAAEAKSKE